MAGITGYKIEEGKVTDPGTNNSFPIVKAVQGWGMLMRPDAAYRKQTFKTVLSKVKGAMCT